MMDNNCVSKMDLRVVSSIFLSGLGYVEYMRLFSMPLVEKSSMFYVDERWPRPQRQKGSAEYLTEGFIDSKTHLVLGIETLCKDEKESGKGNEEALCLLKMLEYSPIKDVQIDEIICDENKSVIKRIKESDSPLKISLCIGHKANAIRKR
ncbi:hypothetical protein M0812_05192 [Anaeramoeba flamelloides]|uniref:Uncharacterized protein n=1 Tax=Anaeramoeba flamelloides TaxID=1746091 RepID=A0AAV8A423_9EUKA|nr:hypothetical protein M0812_05192 [Anaeramoeba flamelloides]